MSIGKLARKILGNHFYIIGRKYRSIFVNLSIVAHSISPHIPKGSMILDIGGGDGEPLNYLLSIRNDIKVKIIDQSLCIGNFLDHSYLSRVELYPGMTMSEYANNKLQKPSVILISDVMHHIPRDMRYAFIAELKASLADNNIGLRIIIKDIEPGYVRSFLSLISDRYISGEKDISLIGRHELIKIIQEIFSNSIIVEETDLFELDSPNYALVFTCK